MHTARLLSKLTQERSILMGESGAQRERGWRLDKATSGATCRAMLLLGSLLS